MQDRTASPAMDEPRTSRAWRSLRGRAVALLVGGVVAVAVAVMLGRSTAAERATLLEQGVRRTATVVEVSSGSLVYAGTVTVSFTLGGSRHRAELPANLEVDPLRVGDTLELAVDPDDPSRAVATAVAARSSGAGLVIVAAGSLGLTSLAVGVVTALRARRWGRILRSAPWRRVPLVHGQTSGTLPRAVLDLGDAGGVAGVHRSPRWILRHLRSRTPTQIVVAGQPGGEQVVAPLSRAALFGVRPPRGERERRRWRAALPR